MRHDEQHPVPTQESDVVGDHGQPGPVGHVAHAGSRPSSSARAWSWLLKCSRSRARVSSSIGELGRPFHRSNRSGITIGRPRNSRRPVNVVSGCSKNDSLSMAWICSAGKYSPSRLQLLGVLAAAKIRVVPVADALVAGVGEHPLGLSCQPLVLEVEGALERLGLEAARQLVLVRRERALDRVAQHRHDAHVRQVLRDPLRGAGVEHVVAARLEGDRLTGDRPVRPAARATAVGKWPWYHAKSRW